MFAESVVSSFEVFISDFLSGLEACAGWYCAQIEIFTVQRGTLIEFEASFSNVLTEFATLRLEPRGPTLKATEKKLTSTLVSFS